MGVFSFILCVFAFYLHKLFCRVSVEHKEGEGMRRNEKKEKKEKEPQAQSPLGSSASSVAAGLFRKLSRRWALKREEKTFLRKKRKKERGDYKGRFLTPTSSLK
jgi:hypothetical protein